MPSHTTSSALIKLFFLDGAPWGWPTWQGRTGIRHGLFPVADEHLPPGWTRQDAVDVQSYFTVYNLVSSEGDKIKFATRSQGGSSYPGRKIWNAFVARNYANWGIHSLIVEELKEWDIHPMTILIRENNLNGQWPNSDIYIPKVLDSLALKLWGFEAFPDGVEVLTTELRKCLQIFVQRSWNTLRVQVSGMRNRQSEVETAAMTAFGDLEEGKLTKAKLTRTIRAVAKWKECAELFSTADNLKKAEEMLTTLHGIMEGLGANVDKNKPRPTKGTCKVSEKALQDLATEGDVSDLLLLYEEYLEMNLDEEDEPPITDISPEKEKLDQDGDFGMEVEANMQSSNFTYRFGFPSGLPIQFNTLRHRSGISPWDDPKPFAEDPIPEELVNFNLHWHQLAGVHSIIRSVFTELPDATHTAGVLIGDEVGLGKTAQAITFIAFLNQSILGVNRHIPRILEPRPYLGASDKIPSLPHLILCPGTLTAQWVAELRLLFIPKSVDIFVYDGRGRADFWGPSGALQQSKQQQHNRIIVASHSVLFNDFTKTHAQQNRKEPRPWEMPQAKRPLTNTIFGQRFLTVVVDEAHHMRNPGNKHLATLRLLQQATVKLIMTATPLHTAPKDIASMGRLVGIPHFYDEVSFIDEKADATRLRRAKKLDDDGEAAHAEQLQVVRRLQGHCKGHFLRRTSQSVDDKGEPLLSLPPYEEIIGVLNLTERETAIMHERAEAAKAAVLSSSSAKIQTKKFYLEYRTAVGYAKENPSDPWPSFDTLEKWAPMKSTKMDVCARICAHYLKRDDASDVTFVKGEPVFPEASHIPEADVKRTRRIIIYAEFPSMAPLLQNVLQLYGVTSLAINGKISFDQRDKRVRELYSDKNPTRVLIFSSIGSAGLNLAIADVVIFFDQPWSAQDERQIRGRAHRQPQAKTVKVIHLLANDSADLLMNGVARGKRDMFDAFVNKELGQELRIILAGCVTDLDEKTSAGVEGATDEMAEPTKKKTRSRKRKPLVVDDDDEPPVVGNLPPPVPDTNNPKDSALSGESSRGSTLEPPESGAESGKDDVDADKMEVDDPSPALEQMTLTVKESDPKPEKPLENPGNETAGARPKSNPFSRGNDGPPLKRPRQDTVGVVNYDTVMENTVMEIEDLGGPSSSQLNDSPGAATLETSIPTSCPIQRETPSVAPPKKNPFAPRPKPAGTSATNPTPITDIPSRRAGLLNEVVLPGKQALKVKPNFKKRHL